MEFPQSVKLVYSTDPSTALEDEKAPEQIPEGDGIVRLHKQTKGLKGKGVTRITGLGLPTAELKQLAAALKKKCGCGGRVHDFEVHLQTQDRDAIKKILEKMSYTVKIAGG